MREGTVVYFVNEDNRVWFGTYSYEAPFTGIVVDLYQIKEHRLVNVDGIKIPFDEFQSTEWKPLPKNWTYNTELYTIEDDSNMEWIKTEIANRRIDNPGDVRYCIEHGILVKTPVYKGIETEIDKNKGYRVVKKCPSWIYGSHKTTEKVDKVFLTYKEAEQYKKQIDDKRNRECFEATVIGKYETLDEQLERYEADHGGKDIERLKQQFLSLPRFCDIVIRYYQKILLWQYKETKTNKWNVMV